MSEINKHNRGFLYSQILSLVCPRRNHVRLLFPHQSLCARASYGGYREQSLINKLTNSPPSGRPLLIIVIEYLYSATFLEAHGGLQQKKKIAINCTEAHVWIRGIAITLRMRVRVFDTRVFRVHWPDRYAMLMSPNKGDTAVHGCHCPGDMVVGKCAPVQLIGIVKKKYQD